MSNPTVPGYGSLEKIGAGGFAAVYRATQTSVGREVALKLLHHAIADADTERRFDRECRVVGSLSWHPHIAAILDAGADEDGRRYLAFELLTGGSLGDRLKASGPIPWAESVRFAIQTADALAAAHEQDVLHRDVKPDNILTDRLGRAKLADFGIAQMRDGNQTKSGVITATLAHAAPEVLSGKRATKLSDVYLLGSTLFELIRGEPPFGSAVGNDFFAAIQRIATEAPPKLVDSAPGVPNDLSELVDRSLRKEPVERFGSVAEFGQALRNFQAENGLAVTDMPFVIAHQTAPSAETPEDVSPAAVQAAVPSSPTPVAPAQPVEAADPYATSIVHREVPPPQPEPVAPASLDAAAELSRAPVQHLAAPISPVGLPSRSSATAAPAAKSKAPLLVILAVAVVAAIVGAVFFLLPGDDEPLGIIPIEALETDSQQGFTADLVIDGDLSTGWLSPDSPDGHEITIGFGKAVALESIVIHGGPNPAGSGALSSSRALGPTVLEFSDGTTIEVALDEDLGSQTVAIGKSTTSLQIRSQSQGSTPVAIREIEFIGEPVS